MKWKRIIGWTATVLLLLIVVGALVSYSILKSEGFHRYVIAKIIDNANQATGGRTEVRTVDFHWSRLSADLYGLTIRGTEPAGAPPLFQVDKLRVGLKILSVLHREVNLSVLKIEHPVIHLVVSKDGTTNIPHPHAHTTKSGSTNVFDLAVGHVLLSNGEIYCNDTKDSLNADVNDLHSEITFSSLLTRYSGSLVYETGRVQFQNFASLPHGMNLQFSAEPSALTLSSFVVTLGSSRVALQAKVSNYANPLAEGTYDIRIHTQDIARMVHSVEPSGDITSSGRLRYQRQPAQSFSQAVAVDGRLDSNGLVVISPQGRVDLRKLSAKYQLARGNLSVDNILASAFHGEVKGSLQVQNLTTQPRGRLQVSLQAISIDALREAVKSPSVRNMPLTGSVDGNADANWTGSVSNVRARSDIGIQAAILNAATWKPVPLKCTIHADYNGSTQTIQVQPSILQTPATSITAQGQISQHSNLNIQAQTSDLQELALLAPAVQQVSESARHTTGGRPVSISIAGAATVNATMRGSMSNPELTAQVAGQNLQYDGSQWSALRFQVQANPAGVTVQNGTLTNARQGQVNFTARVGLRDWSYLPANSIAATASIRRLPVAELEKLAGKKFPVTGDLSGDLLLQGSQLNPQGHGSLQLAQAHLYDEPIQTIAAQFQAANGSIHSTLDVKLPAGALAAKLSFTPKTRAFELHVDAPSIQLDQLQTASAHRVPLNGTLTASANGSGTLDNPQLTATLELPKFEVQQTTVTGIKADLAIANRRANLTLSSNVAEATVRAKGTIDLSGDYNTDATIETTKVPLDPLLAILLTTHPNGFHGETELHATLKGPLKDKSRIEAHLTIPTLTAAYQSLQIANVGPIRADYVQSLLTLQPSELKGTGTSLRFQGRIPLGSEEAMNVTAQGSVDMRMLEIFEPNIQSGGVVALDVHTTGNAARPEVQGEIKLQDVAVIASDAPLGLEHANGTLDLSNDQLHINQLTGQVGGGQLSAAGSITYRPKIQFNVALDAKSVRLRYPEGVRTVFDGNLALTGTQQDAALTGRLLIDGLSFSSDFDLSTLMSQFTATNAPPLEQGFANRTKLNINVQSAQDLSAASSQLSIEGQVNLRVVGTAAEPVIIGRTDLTAGDIFFLKQRYQLERGLINFTNPNRTHPVVNILMTTTINQYNLHLRVTGPMEKLTTSYTSDPPLPPVDIINLIARGQTTEEGTPTSVGADQVLAQGIASQVSGSVEKMAGMSSLQIDPQLGGNNRNPGARIAIQKRITKNFIFTFSTDVTDPQSEIIQGEYQINKRWSVSAARDEGGGVAVDGRYHTSF